MSSTGQNSSENTSASRAVELSLFANRVRAVSEEMGGLLGRAALSPNIRDRLDYSCAVFDRHGNLLGQATHIPVHLGSMAYVMHNLTGAFDWSAGDMLVFNDPFQGGTHLPDVTFVAPVFQGPELVGFCANRAHHADIGSDAPGSMPLSSRLEEEGVIIPPTKVVRAGQMDEQWFAAFFGQLGSSAIAEGDFAAQMAANRLGCKRMARLAENYGDSFFALAEQLQNYGERLARLSLAAIPNGCYHFSDVLDDDGFGRENIPISLALHVTEEGIELDFSDTSAQVQGNLNCPLSVTAAAVFYVFRCLMPDQVPACQGAMQAITIKAPEGCLVNARYPAAVAAGNVETSMRIVDVVCGALAQALPGRIPAASQGTMNNIAMGSRTGLVWDYYETLAGGNGGGPDCHGQSARHSHMTNTLNTPVEVLERHYPLRLLRYAVRDHSGGTGRYRGGDGLIRDYLFLSDASLSLISERRTTRPWGLDGGSGGSPGVNELDGRDIGSKCQRDVRAGQVLHIATPGGGGYGQSGRD